MGAHIRPEGWENWGKTSNEATAYYTEFASTGPGANPQARVKWSRKLTTKEANQYTLKTILKGIGSWEPALK